VPVEEREDGDDDDGHHREREVQQRHGSFSLPMSGSPLGVT